MPFYIFASFVLLPYRFIFKMSATLKAYLLPPSSSVMKVTVYGYATRRSRRRGFKSYSDFLSTSVTTMIDPAKPIYVKFTTRIWDVTISEGNRSGWLNSIIIIIPEEDFRKRMKRASREKKTIRQQRAKTLLIKTLCIGLLYICPSYVQYDYFICLLNSISSKLILSGRHCENTKISYLQHLNHIGRCWHYPQNHS